MRKKVLGITTIVALLAVVGGGFATASDRSPAVPRIGSWGERLGSPSSPDPAELATHEGGQTLVLRNPAVNEKFIDLDGGGPSPGDLLVFRDAVYNERRTERLGQGNGQCIFQFPLSADKFSIYCFGSFTFTGEGAPGKGSIALAGYLSFGPSGPLTPLDLAITGGTGHYQNARGEIHNPPGDKIILHIVP